MLLKWAWTQDGKEIAQRQLDFMRNENLLNGRKGVNVNNFIDLDMTYMRFKLNGKTYKGYYSSQDCDRIHMILDYNEGEIIIIN